MSSSLWVAGPRDGARRRLIDLRDIGKPATVLQSPYADSRKNGDFFLRSAVQRFGDARQLNSA